MKTLEYVKEHIDEFEMDNLFDSRFTKRFIDFIPVSEWDNYEFRYTGEKDNEPVPIPWTEENILTQLKKDVAFGIEKATDHRGISASLMFDVVKAWCLVLENGLANTDYGYYGDKLFKAVDEYYHFGLVDKNTFSGDFYGDWS